MKLFNNLFTNNSTASVAKTDNIEDNKDFRNDILNDRIVRDSEVSDEVKEMAAHYLVNGPVHGNALMLRWDDDGLRQRVALDDNQRSDVDTIKASIREFISKNDNKGNQIQQNGDLYTFDSHRQMMACLLHLKRRFNWVCFSDHADVSGTSVPRSPVVHYYGLMKLDGNHVESYDMTDFNYF